MESHSQIVNIVLATIAGSCILIICGHAIRAKSKRNEERRKQLLTTDDGGSQDYTYVYETEEYDFDNYKSENDNVSRGFNYNQSINCSNDYMTGKTRKKRSKGQSLLDPTEQDGQAHG